MIVCYTGEEAPSKFNKSLFLCGPSVRPSQEKELESWRKNALQILDDKGFDGVVFCPEPRDFTFTNKDFDYDSQIEWEEKYLNIADCILFWVPRDLSLDNSGNMKLPGLTTNIEWGRWENSGKVVLGYPEDAEKVSYIQHYADKLNIKSYNTLTETVQAAIDFVGPGVERSGGERFVPLYIWNTPQFQSWYQAQTTAGNRLDNARILYNFRPGNKSFVFLWVLKVDVFIASENRHKTNEFVLARPDVSAVLMWKPANNTMDSEIVLVKEFRSPASTEDGFIRELVGGSSTKKEEMAQVAADETREETGFYLEASRLHFECARQLNGTLSSHKAHLFTVELTVSEIEWFKSQEGIAHGNAQDSEQTYVEVTTLENILKKSLVDWTTVGMIMQTIYSQFDQ